MRARSNYVFGSRQYAPLYVVRCAWCAATIRETPHLVDVVSHGLCPSCGDKFAADGLAVARGARDGAAAQSGPSDRRAIDRHATAPIRKVDTVLERLRAEFLEMPGLRLTEPQVRRLCGVEQPLCQRMLDSLVNARFLCRKSDGAYSRLSDGEIPRPRPAKAVLAAVTCVVGV
jgi:hypothetical protein